MDSILFPRFNELQSRQRQEQQQQQLVFQDYHVRDLERNRDEARKVARDVEELATMAKDLNEIVHDQGDSIQVVVDNVSTTKDNVVRGNEQLTEVG